MLSVVAEVVETISVGVVSGRNSAIVQVSSLIRTDEAAAVTAFSFFSST